MVHMPSEQVMSLRDSPVSIPHPAQEAPAAQMLLLQSTGDSISGLNTCAASALPAEPSPQPLT